MKRIFVAMLILYMVINPCGASSEWIYSDGNRDMKVGNCLTIDDYTITLKDYSTNDDGLKDSILIEIANGVNKQTEIIQIGKSFKFGDDKYSITYVNYKKGKINVALYKYTSPIFKFSSETEETNSNKYNYKSTITLTCCDADAYNIKVSYDDNVRGNFDDFKISCLKVGKSKGIDIKYSYDEDSKLIMNVEYEDGEGNEYKQSYDVVCNLVVTEEIEPTKEKSEGVRVVHKYSSEYYAKKIFINAIDTALNKITFTETEKLQLTQIRDSLKKSIQGENA